MKILMLHIAYNELNLLRYKLAHCKRNGIELFVIDNMSNDGTGQWLKENNVNHSFIDTNDSFDLRPLCAEMTKKVHELKPDWFIYAGVDMFHESANGVSAMIEDCDKDGFTQIRLKQYSFERTDEQVDKEGNPFNNYFYCMHRGAYVLISKYDKSINIVPDGIERNNAIIKDGNGVVFEMHASKSVEERIVFFRRRQKAWQNGLASNMGGHLASGAKSNFTFKKSTLSDVREMKELFELHKRLQLL